MYQIDENLKDFIESGVATLVATGDSTGRPHLAYGWAPRVADPAGVVEVFLDTARAGPLIADLRANRRIAVTMAHPVYYRSVQLKGDFQNLSDPSDSDKSYVQQRRGDFLTSTSLVGDPPESIRNLWLEDVVRIAFTVNQAYDQTPGPNAGKPL
ncbi:MAG TPA: pyridoxamine 5'-phosphate oxidase family protein [Dehalococcoidia bacterium]|nr:pyridoxamine 5'-phosphate oxidase family protein [Dehalococcoidia bacterium]